MATQPITTTAGLVPAASIANFTIDIDVLFSVEPRADGGYGGGFFFLDRISKVSVADPDGSIHIGRVSNIPSGQIDLIFTLNGVSITPGGWVEKITWDPRISGQNGSSGAINLINARPGVRAKFMPESVLIIVVSIADKNLLPFSYDPGIVLPSRGNYYISGGAKPVTGGT